MKSVKQFCEDVLLELKESGSRYGEIYVSRTMEFYRTYKYNPEVKQKFGLFSSMSNNMFEEIVACLNGKVWLKPDGKKWGKDDIYELNFIQFIEFHKLQEKNSN